MSDSGYDRDIILREVNRLMQTNLSTYSIHQQSFPSFKNLHQGKKVAVVACGPSLKNYRPLSDTIHIGVNAAFKNELINFDYLFLQDFSGKTPDYIEDLISYRPDKCVKFFGLTNEWTQNPNRVVPESIAVRAHALRYRTDWAHIKGFRPKFAYDLSAMPLCCHGSIVFPALQFALWTNPAEIYLVGCDCSNEGYFYDEKSQNFLIVDEVIAAYREFKVFASVYYPETRIVSVNPQGLKGIFEDFNQE
ncbi:MAG: hypothetical protein IJ228_02015 [Succinivibrio sp.]|nr:hypothetical protein [Succinivibrio sp.]